MAPPIPNCRSLSLLVERSACTLWAADSDTHGGAVTVTVYNRPLDEAAGRRFDAAVRTATALGRHPHLVTMYDSGRLADGRAYVVSDGHERTTAEGLLLTAGVLDVERVLRMGIALAGALETAHRAGVIHGGVSPALVLVRADGQPVLTEVALTEFGQPAGISAFLDHSIPYHAPPEVLESTEQSPATDVYSLASVVYTLLVGDPPHASHGVVDSTASLLLRILQMPMPTIQRSDVPPGLEDTLRGALAHVPGKRPQQVLELAWAFQEAQRVAGMDVSEPIVLDPSDQGGPGDPGATSPSLSRMSPSPLVPAAPTGAGGVVPGNVAAGLGLPALDPLPAGLDGRNGASPGVAAAAGTALAGPATVPGVPGDPLRPAAFGGTDRPGPPAWPGDTTDGDQALAALDAEPLQADRAAPPTAGPTADTVEPVVGTAGPAEAAGPALGSIDEPGRLPSRWPRGEVVGRELGDGPSDLGRPPAGEGPAGTGGPDAVPTGPTTGAFARLTPWAPPAKPPSDDDLGLNGNRSPAAHGGDPHPGANGTRRPHGDTADSAATGAPGAAATAPAVGGPFADPTFGDPFVNPAAGGPFASGPSAAGTAGEPLADPTASGPFADPTASGPFADPTASGPFGHSAAGGALADPTASGPFGAGAATAAGGAEDERPWWAMFGAAEPAAEAPPAPAAPAARWSGSSPGTPQAPVHDPTLDPPSIRPADTPAAAAARARTPQVSTRAASHEGRVTALERARQARLERQRQGGDTGTPTAAREPAPPVRDEPSELPTRTGPPALPVIVLVAVVVLLGLGGAYLVITGEDSPDDTRAEERRGTTTSSSSTATTGPAGLGNLRAVETNDGGVQLDWDGPEAAYTVRILAADAAPRALPGGPATALMVPQALLTSSGGMCFEVSPSTTGQTAGPGPTTTTAPGAAAPATTAAPGSAAATATTAATAATGTTAPATTAAPGSATTAPGGPATTTATGTDGELPIDCVRGATPATVRRA